MNDISIFRRSGVDIRVVMIEGEPWWVAADVATMLGYRMAADLTRTLDDDEKGTRPVRTPGGEQLLAIINEGGLFKAIVQRQTGRMLDEMQRSVIKDFQRWVTHEVLPDIRKTGSYAVAPTTRAVPQSFAEALRDFAAEIDAHEATKAELAEVAPRAEAWDAIASAAGDYAVGDAAKMLSRAGIPTGPQRLFDQLGALKWTYRGEGGKWRAYAERVELGYLTERPQFHYHPKTGERVIDQPQLRVTIKGLERLRQRLHVGALKAVSA